MQTSTVLALLISVGLAMYLLGKEITEEKMNSKIRVLHRRLHELERSR